MTGQSSPSPDTGTTGCLPGCKPGGACKWVGCANLCTGCPSAFGFRFHRYPCSRAGTIDDPAGFAAGQGTT